MVSEPLKANESAIVDSHVGLKLVEYSLRVGADTNRPQVKALSTKKGG